MKKPLSIIVTLVMLVTLTGALTGCTAEKPPEPPVAVMQEVYADDTLEIDAGIPEAAGESGNVYRLHLHISNRGKAPVILSTSLCMYVTSGAERIQCSAPRGCGISDTDAYHGLDGIIAPQQYADGWVVFECADLSGASMNIATDLINSQWVSFDLMSSN